MYLDVENDAGKAFAGYMTWFTYMMKHITYIPQTNVFPQRATAVSESYF